MLLLLGYDRISPEFFQFIIDGSTTYSPGNALTGAAALEAAVHRFRTLALLLFGNVKFAFKRLHADPEELAAWLGVLEPRDEQSFRDRHDPIQPIDPIDPADTYLLGYLIEGEIRDKLDANPHDAMYLALQERRREIIERGKKNQAAYLVSDHLDVYVATSMRARHEYALVSEFCQALFALPSLAPLKLRWFDPTQAYCHDRIDKGLAEALMLKRARCTIYLAQESDTLGKDSELASTLAQGKPVIAFVPEVDEAFVDGLVDKMRGSDPEVGEAGVMLELLRLSDVAAAWRDASVRNWLSDPVACERDKAELRNKLIAAVKRQYDARATMLRERHPLGIQVNLATGVANGVLVVRTVEQCAELVRQIVTSTLEFHVEEAELGGLPYVFLRERISGCIFRVMTGDQQLSNAFWNFYLQPS